jgi:hypothetical protein
MWYADWERRTTREKREAKREESGCATREEVLIIIVET